MIAQDLLADLEARGVQLSADGHRLRVNAAAGQLSADEKQRIATLKAQIIALLAERSAAFEGEFPVSFAQRRLWFLDRLEPGNAAYHLGALHDIASPLDQAAMEAAVNDVVRRQAALRTVFREVDGEPVQVVRPFQPVTLPLIDLSAMPPGLVEQELRRVTREAAAQAFDLSTGPLFRAALVRLGTQRWRLLYTMHHIVGDGWSLGTFLADLHVAYAARADGRAPVFRPLSLQFGQHAARERELLSGPALGPLVDYWRGRLASATPVLNLPTDRPRPRQRSFEGASVSLVLPPEVCDGLRALARQERCTMYMVLLALYDVLLFRYSGQSDVVVGTPVANRLASQAEDVVGMFVGTLPMRNDLRADISLRELLAQVRENVLEAQAHAALPFEKMVDEIRAERSLAWSPVYQVIFALQNMPLSTQFEVTTVAAMVDLSLFMWDEPQGIRGTLEYNTALFDDTTARRMRDHFVQLAASAASAPDQPIGRLRMLGDDEQAQLLQAWNATARPYPRDADLATLFETAAQRWPDAVAVETADAGAEPLGQAQLSYAQLAAGSRRLADQLRALGVRPGDAVALCLDRSIAAVATILAIVRTGAAYVPIDAADPPARRERILADAGVQVLVTQRSLAAVVTGAVARVIEVESAWAGGAGAASPVLPAGAITAESLAYIMFTSGTTGVPKGVCVTHRNVARLVCHSDFAELGPAQTSLLAAPLAFDASTLELWGALLNGGRLVVQPRAVPTAADMAQVLRKHRITTLWLTAGFFHHMVEEELASLAGVRQVLAGGDVLSVSHVQRLLDAKSDGVVVNGYGPTENTTFSCCHRMLPGTRLADSVPIGRPIANSRAYILDAMGQPVPPGVIGELHLGGDGVARGYLGNIQATAERFLPDPFDPRPGMRMYRTGDLACWRADGSIDFLGRVDRQLKVRGFRIEPEEIEEALRAQPGVRDAVVVARADGSASSSLLAYVVATPLAHIDDHELRLALADRLPAYMVPAAVVVLDALPLTANGKLDREALPVPAAVAAAGSVIVEPRTLIEAQLHAIWERVLDRSGIGVTDNFFELGGHSLLAVRLFAQIEKVFGVRLPVSALFVAPDIAQLAQRLKEEGFRSPWTALVAIRGDGARRPLFLVPGIGGNVLCYSDLARQLGPDQPLYGLQSRGLDERETPFEQIEPMAAHYVAEIRRAQPLGPYRLGGSCFGGVVAYEMAQQLRAAGEQVELLFLLESWPPPQRHWFDSLRIRSNAIGFVLEASRRNLAAMRRLSMIQRLRALFAALRIVGEMASKRDLYRGDRAQMYQDRVSLANQRALARYRLRPYDGRLRAAIAALRQFSGEDGRARWRSLAPRDYAEVSLPAKDSGTMLLPPASVSLAGWMREVIEELDGAASRATGPG